MTDECSITIFERHGYFEKGGYLGKNGYNTVEIGTLTKWKFE